MEFVIPKEKTLFLISGPCVIESEEHALYMAKQILAICNRLGVFLIYKSSFDKANRSSINSYRGQGIEEGLRILIKIKTIYNIPVCCDIHESYQAQIAADAGVDILQIPAFLCRQTDLLLAAAKTGKYVSIKKGQFCNDKTMQNAYQKIKSVGNNKIILADRGTMFGYDDLIVDFRNLVKMRENPEALIIQDATHSLQQPNRGDTTHGLRYLIPTIARCAVATGVDGLFMEVHDNPEKALSDATTQWPLDKLEELLVELLEIHKTTRGRETQYVV